MESFFLVLFIAANILFDLPTKKCLNTSTSATQKTIHKEIYFYLGKVGSKSEAFAERYNMKPIFLIGGNAIDPENNGSISISSLQKDIRRIIPNQEATGIAILDWEGKTMNQLSTLPVSDSLFGKALDKGVEMVKTAKFLRPKIKWGIYALPFRNYWSRNNEWRIRSFSLMPLLKECDVIAPSIYDLYPDSALENENRVYIEDNVRLALDIGRRLNKPVLPFVTHRWPNSKLIPRKEFINSVNTIFKTKGIDNKVAGIIWWGPDDYYFRTGDKEVRMEVKRGQGFSSYSDNLIYSYLSLIVQLPSFWNN